MIVFAPVKVFLMGIWVMGPSLAFTEPQSTTKPAFARVSSRTELGVFPFKNGNNGGEGEPPQKDDNDNFPAWVKGLSQWPPYPSKQASILDVSEQEQEIMKAILGVDNNEPPRSELPLATLINVEALLMASGEKTMEEEKDLAMFELDSNKYMEERAGKPYNGTKSPASPLDFLPKIQEFGDWGSMVGNLQKSVSSISDVATESSSVAIGSAAETILKEATARLEYLVSEVSTAISPQAVQDLVLRAGRTLRLNETAANDLVKVAERLAREQGVDVRDAADRARETTKFTTGFVNTANALLVAGYARLDTEGRVCVEDSAAPLFADFESARLVTAGDRSVMVNKAAELGTMSGAIYQDTMQRTFQLGHSMVANGTTANVVWMVSDSLGEKASFSRKAKDDSPFLTRTITIRGFDASDESVDREELLVDICTAPQEPLGNKGVFVHGGLLKIARAIYADIIEYIDSTAPSHKIVINGHSVGGSLSQLVLMLLTEERGAKFVKERVARVYTFGSPPIATTRKLDQGEEDLESSDDKSASPEAEADSLYPCEVLKRFGLPSNIVYGYVQPWDPIVRLFSEIDPLYPLLGDLGEDGKTLYASGPQRTLRPITRAIIESWEGWPRFRDNFRATVSQNYTSTGIQHILLPDPVRYLSDRLVAVNVQIPPVEKVLRISSRELLPALTQAFPLNVFQISFVPAAIRSFLHHFYPAYGFPIVEFADKKKGVPSELNDSEREDYAQAMKGIEQRLDIRNTDSKEGKATSSSSQWLQFPSDW